MTVSAASLVGHYTAIRLWKEVLLAVLAVGCGLAIIRTPGWPRVLRRQRLIILIALYIAVLLLVGLIGLGKQAVGGKALAYGLLLDTRFLVFFGVVWMVSHCSNWITCHYRQLLLIPATIVVMFGLLQFLVLPANFFESFWLWAEYDRGAADG